MQQAAVQSPLVLVIDDDPTIHLWAQRQLGNAGFRLISSANGREGVIAFKEQAPDVVLVDIEMPEMDGFDTCCCLRELPNGKNTPLVMVTGTEDAKRIEKAYSAGANDFVVKPFNWKVLIQRLRYMIQASDTLRRLEQSESRLTKAQQLAKLGYWDWNANEDKLYWSEEIYQIFRLQRDAFVPEQAHFLELVDAVDRLFVEDSFNTVLKSGEPLSIEYRVKTDNSWQCFVSQRIERTVNQQGQIIGLSGTIQDVTERKDYENKVRRLAYYDAVTGLPNRFCFLELLSKALELAQRYERNFAVMFLDLDGFKAINDAYGHHFGDLVLKEIARRLTEGLRRSDVVTRYTKHFDYAVEIARLGGDEFTILVNELTRPEDAAVVATHVLEWFAQPVLVENLQIYTTASIGIALYPQDGTESAVLLRNADTAMYHAKNLGKANYQFFHASMGSKAKKALQIESAMPHAAANQELRLFYQPLIHIESGRLLGAEALLRWQHPTLGLLYPDEFIALAERNGTVLKFDEWVFREACRQFKAWQQQNMGHLSIAVNISDNQLYQESFLPMLQSVLKVYQLDATFLIFELSERILIANDKKMLETLNGLKGMGIRLTIDDFAMGYSLLSNLKRFPIDALKIDRTFIQQLPFNTEDAAFVAAIMALADSLDIKVIAEGVETHQQRDFFARHACDSIQGNLVSRPMQADQFHLFWRSYPN